MCNFRAKIVLATRRGSQEASPPPNSAHFGITWCITCKDIHLVPVKKLQRDFVLYAYFITQFTACLMALLKKITITHIDTLRIVKLVALAYTKF